MCIEPPEAYPSRDLLISSGVGKITLNLGLGVLFFVGGDNESNKVRCNHLSVEANVAIEDICTTMSDSPE